jgi:lysophospholipase L1-like esterase
MPIGDSITDGVGSSSGTGFRAYLYDKLQGVNFSLVGPNGSAPLNGHFTRGAKIEEFYTGGFGTGTRDIASSMNTYQPDIILIHLGTNNMNNDDASPYSENTGITMQQTSSGKLAELLAYASQWSNGTRGDFLKRIIVCKIIPRLVNGSVDAKVAEFNAEIDRMFFENAPGITVSKLTLVDMNSTVLISDLGDGTHPNDAGYNKMAKEFDRVLRGIISGDKTAPSANTWLGADPLDGNTAGLTWQSVGDDGLNGQANLYEMRYATFQLTTTNFSQGILVSLPKPQTSGNIESASVSGLVPGISYFFGIRTYDEMNNRGTLSFSPPVDMADTASTEYCDDFTDALAANWNLNPAYRIDMTRGELVNGSTSSGWNYLATYKAARYASGIRGVRAAMQWSEISDASGINASGIAMMLNAASYQASGYLVRVRNRVVYLNEIVSGNVITANISSIAFNPAVADPKPGDILEVKYNPSTTTGHAFNVYLNNVYLGDVFDASKRQGNSSQLYSGIVLYGGLNNSIDNFCLEVPPLEPDSMYIAAGDNKHGTVTQRLAEPLAVRVVDANSVPVSDVQVQFSVISGQATLSTDSLDVNFNGNIWVEAESGDMQAPYVTGSSADASGSEYIYVPYVVGNSYTGLTTYQIYIPKAGSYRLYLRGNGPDGNQNSCFYSFGTDTVQVNFTSYKTWEWVVAARSVTLSKGFTKLTIKNREAGLQLDKLLLTSNTSYVPSGTGLTTQRFSNITDASGSAYTFISFGTAAGQVVVRASAPAVPNNSQLDFTLYADALDPLALQYASETILTGVAGQSLEKEFAVLLMDQYNNYCVGVPVQFTVTEGDGHFSRQDSIRVSSNSAGIASARFTLGYTASANKILATLPEVPDLTPLSFQAIAGEGIPVSISAISGHAQIDTVQQTLAQPLVVQVLDEKSRPVLNYPVTFEIIRNNGLLNGSARTVIDSTDSDGKTSVTWTLGDTAGTANNIVRINVPLTGAPLYFTASGLPEVPAVMTILSGDNQTGYAGEELPAPLVAKISDRLGNGRKDQSVTFSVVSGSGTFAGTATATVITDTLGRAVTTFRAGSKTGAAQIKADADPNLGIGAKIFNQTILPPRATTLSAVSGMGQEGIILTTLARPFKIKLTNPFDTAVPNVKVRFKSIAGLGTFSGKDSVDLITGSTGEAEALLTLGTLAGEAKHRVIVSVPGYTITPLEFTATALPGAAESIEPVSDVMFSEQAEATVPITVVVKDAYGNSKSGHLVAFTVSDAGNGSFTSGGRYLEVNSNGSGLATVQYKMGTNSTIENTIAVTSARAGSSTQLTGSPILFNGRVIAGAPRLLAQITQATGLGAKINSTLPQSFTVEVRDIHGNPTAQGVIVNFKVITGEGKFGDATELDVNSDANGRASALLRVGMTAGINNNVVRVSVSGHPEILPVDFTASTYPGDPDQLSYGGEKLWNGRVLANYTAKAVVKDVKGNLIEGHPVLFRVTRGGGTVYSAASSAARDTMTIYTNNVGVATAFWTVGSKPDTNKLDAAASYQNSPLQGSPITFTASASAEDPVTMRLISAVRDSGVIHQPLPRPLKVQIIDRWGNSVANHPVLFTTKYPVTPGYQGKLFISSLADTAVSKSVNTDGNGYATVYFLLGPQTGLNHIQIESRFNGTHLTGSPVDIYVEGLASPAKTLLLLSSSTVSGTAGSTVNVKVRTNNSEGKPVGGHPVQFSVIDSYSAIGSAGTTWLTLTTDAATGEATAAWILGGKVGAQVNTLVIDAGGLANSPLTIKADVQAGAPHAPACRMTATDSVVADNLSSSFLTVTLKDSFANPVSGKQILFVSADQGLTFTQPGQFTNALGQATGTVRSNRSGQKTIKAKLGNTGTEIASARVTFVAGPPKQMAAYSSSAITVNAGALAHDSLAVLVTDVLQNPVAKVPVTFAITSGGGYLLGSQLSSFTTQSNSSGIASARLVAGSKTGEPIIVGATSTHPQLTNAKVSFVATVVAGVPALVQKYGGDGQSGKVGSELTLPLQVRVIDSKSDPVAGISIRFTVQDSGAAILSQNPIQTDYMGLANARYKLGYRAGEPPQIISAQITGSTLSASFIAYAIGEGAKKLELFSGNNQVGVAGKSSPQPMQVRVVDDYGNGVADAVVIFRLADNTGGGQVSLDTLRTDLNGMTSLQPILPQKVGEYIYIATTPLLAPQSAAFYCTVGADVPYRLDKYSGDYQSMTAGRELNYPVTVMVTDQYGNRVPNINIQFAVLNSSGSVMNATVASDENGLAACRWILAPQPKTNTLMAYKLGLRNSPVQFSAIGVLNQYPRFIDLPAQPLLIEYNKSYSLALKAEDGDGDALKYALKLIPSATNAHFDSVASHIFTWKPTVLQKGSYQINLRVEDGRGGFDVDSLLVSVMGDSAPVFTSTYPADRLLPLTYPANQLFTCAAIDYDNDPIVFTWYVDGVARTTGPRFEMISSQYSKGSHYLWVIASDGIKSTQSDMWEIMVDAIELSSFAAAAEPYAGVILRWSTSRETDNLGFDVLRSASERGNYLRITSELIPSREDGHYLFQDSSATAGQRYFYKIEDLSRGGTRTQHGPVEAQLNLPETYALEQNFPNPFNPTTAVRFQLPQADQVKLIVFNTLGQQVRTLVDGKLVAGYHAIAWDGRNETGERVASGVYYYRLVTPRYQAIKKMALVK